MDVLNILDLTLYIYAVKEKEEATFWYWLNLQHFILTWLRGFGVHSALVLLKPCYDDRIINFPMDFSLVFLITSEWFTNKNLFLHSKWSELVFGFHFNVWELEKSKAHSYLDIHLVQRTLVVWYSHCLGCVLLDLFPESTAL